MPFSSSLRRQKPSPRRGSPSRRQRPRRSGDAPSRRRETESAEETKIVGRSSATTTTTTSVGATTTTPGPGRARNLYSSEVRSLLADTKRREKEEESETTTWEREAEMELERHVQDCAEQAGKVFDAELHRREGEGTMLSPRDRWAQLLRRGAKTDPESPHRDEGLVETVLRANAKSASGRAEFPFVREREKSTLAREAESAFERRMRMIREAES